MEQESLLLTHGMQIFGRVDRDIRRHFQLEVPSNEEKLSFVTKTLSEPCFWP